MSDQQAAETAQETTPLPADNSSRLPQPDDNMATAGNRESNDAELRRKIDARTEYLNSIKLLLS